MHFTHTHAHKFVLCFVYSCILLEDTCRWNKLMYAMSRDDRPFGRFVCVIHIAGVEFDAMALRLCG